MAKKLTSLFSNYKRYSAAAILGFLLILPMLALPQQTHAAATSASSTTCDWLGSVPFIMPGCLALKAITYSSDFIKDPIGSAADWTVGNMFSQLMQLLFMIINVIASIAGWLFDFTILEMLSNKLPNLPSITLGWSVVRDVSNLFFIFIMLAISIATILRIESYGAKNLLARLIIIALLINFSLPISKAVIDISNIFAATFYEQILSDSKKCGDNKDCTIFERVSNFANIHTVLAPNALEQTGKSFSNTKTGIIYLGASVFLGILAFVWLAFAVLFILRSITLMFVLILAPIGFLAMVLPKTQSIASRWWGTLLSQAFFAPAAMFFIYLSLKMASGLALVDGTTDTFAKAILGEGGNFAIIYNFILICGLLLMSLTISKEMGATGASTAITWGDAAYKGAKGYAGQQTIGRGASRLASSETMQKLAAYSPRIGGALYGALQGVGADFKKAEKEKLTKLASLSAANIPTALSGLNAGQRKTFYEGLSPDKRIAAQLAAEKSGNAGDIATLKALRAGLSAEDEKKTQAAEDKQRKLATQPVTEAHTRGQALEQLKDPTLITDLTNAIDKMSTTGDHADMAKLVQIFEDAEFTDINDAIDKLRAINPALSAHLSTKMPANIILNQYITDAQERANLKAVAPLGAVR